MANEEKFNVRQMDERQLATWEELRKRIESIAPNCTAEGLLHLSEALKTVCTEERIIANRL